MVRKLYLSSRFVYLSFREKSETRIKEGEMDCFPCGENRQIQGPRKGRRIFPISNRLREEGEHFQNIFLVDTVLIFTFSVI